MHESKTRSYLDQDLAGKLLASMNGLVVQTSLCLPIQGRPSCCLDSTKFPTWHCQARPCIANAFDGTNEVANIRSKDFNAQGLKLANDVCRYASPMCFDALGEVAKDV